METMPICKTCRKPIRPDAPMGLCPQCLVKAGLLSGSEAGSGGRGPFIPPSVEELARLFPQLEIIKLIGSGGMGAVYKARQKQLQRFVALKILPPSIGGDPAFAGRFTREAQALAQLNHPGIVTLYEFGQVEGMPFFLMEYVDGVNLGQALAHHRISPREALSIVPQICDALQFAHDQGIVHRDIKPENILLDRRGRVKVADFGLAILASGRSAPASGAAVLSGPATLTEAGKVVGTPRYMSPEQLEHPGEVDHRADIYALGVVFYQMLTGELPGRRIEPPSRRFHLDVRFDEVVLRALEQKPELRYQHASDLKTRLEEIAGPSGASAGTTAVPPRSRREFLIRAALVGTLIIGGVIAIVAILAPRSTPPTALSEPRPLDVIAQTIKNEIGRELREAGAVYDDLQVARAADRDSATPFKVSYRGLRNFKGADGTAPGANGEFIVNYVGGGRWQGTLAGTRFTVQVGSKDKIDLPFVDDPEVLGEWKSIDLVSEIADFDPAHRKWNGDLYLKGLIFLANGKTPQPWWTWTRGVLIHHGDQTASHYEIRPVNGRRYLFLEWKSGDFTVTGRKPPYYVLQRNQP